MATFTLKESHPDKGLKTDCLFTIQSIHQSQNFYSQSLILKGSLKENSKNISCDIFLKNPKDLVDTSYSYKLTGQLLKKDNRNVFKPKGPWVQESKIFSLVKERFLAKESIKKRFFNKIKDKKAAAFLNGIFTGELQDQELRFNLGRLGLQHILAISGFHFAILSSLLFLPLKLLFRPKMATLILIVCMTIYYLFIGPSPSVTRAWISTILFFGGLVLEKESSALNRLGIALLFLCFIDPQSIKNLSFILSFSATLGILLFYEPILKVLEAFFGKPSFEEVKKFSLLDQIGIILFSYLKKAIALSLAVNTIVLPILLYYFHSFNLLAFLYNLFIPFLIIPSMMLLLAALFLDFLCPYPFDFIYDINSFYTSLVLRTTSDIPLVFHKYFYCTWIDTPLLFLYLTFIVIFGLLWQETTNNKKNLLLELI